MFQDLDAALKRLLLDPYQDPAIAADVSFQTPDRHFTPNDPVLNLFRYGVRENRLLRDPVPIVELVGGTFVRRTPPLRVDCEYLVTSWSKAVGDKAVAVDAMLLAAALVKLARRPTIPAHHLQDSLADQPFPVQMWVAQSDDGKSLGEFWTALGISPRASFHLTVTIAMDLAVQEPEGPPVTTRAVRLHRDLDPKSDAEVFFAIGGVVRDGAAKPVAKAIVTLDGERPAETDDLGRFRIPSVAPGNHALHATADGHPPAGVTVTVPANTKDPYDIQFPP